jgi:hypothetical protein
LDFVFEVDIELDPVVTVVPVEVEPVVGVLEDEPL